MLKIKDDVDLKELEKFGFVRVDFDDGKFRYQFPSDDIVMSIESDDRYIDIWSEYFGLGYEEKLFDLIQAGLVEKVEG